MRFVQYTQTATIRQRQFANRFTGSRFAVDASRFYRKSDKPSLIRWKRIPEKDLQDLHLYFASNCQGLLKTLWNKITRFSQSRPVLPEVDVQDT